MPEFTVSEDDDGIRLDRWFKRHQSHIPHSMLQKLLRKKAVRLDKKKAETSTRVTTGQTVTTPEIARPNIKEVQKVMPSEALIKQLQDRVIYKDQNLLIINKPAGLATQGGSKVKHSVDDILPFMQFDASITPKLVHRLDKDTSGILLLARTQKAAAELTKQFKSKEITKTYIALVKNIPMDYSGKIDLPLGSGGSNHEKMYVDHEDGKRAITEYTMIERMGSNMSWLEVTPLTGRKHQIRVHLAANGTPIIGDGKYGGSNAFIEGISDKMHLHAWQISLQLFGKQVGVQADLPPHMAETAPF